MRCGKVKNIGLNELVNRGNSAPSAPIPKYRAIGNPGPRIPNRTPESQRSYDFLIVASESGIGAPDCQVARISQPGGTDIVTYFG